MIVCLRPEFGNLPARFSRLFNLKRIMNRKNLPVRFTGSAIMKFKDVLILAFLAGLLIYAICHRAGFVGNHPAKPDEVSSRKDHERVDTLMYDKWIFAVHPDQGLRVFSLCGDTIHHLPGFTSGLAGIDTQPDPTGLSDGLVVVQSDCGEASPSFRIMRNGTLENVTI
jgi:hypothetical protein